ncbi:metal-dependent hydrolase [Alcanivorax sp.]|jgi:predicted metal-dependent hydrolase|uniref:metal-dependent hydrolase n=1 Tax=Alcanivorax sp. TaxID=1872427 RepID=UPI0032D9456A
MNYYQSAKCPEIPVRNADFGFDEIPKYWMANDPLMTHYFTGLSTLFPEGEAFFVRAVRSLRGKVKSNQDMDVKIGAFIGQEAMHSREHHAFHLSAKKHGLDPESLEDFTGKILGFIERNTSPKTRLLITTALEHYTAVLVVEMMRSVNEFMTDDNIRDLWLWHSVEETEHKAVAFDMYEYLYGKGLSAYIPRVTVYGASLALISVASVGYQFVLMKRDGQWPSMKSLGQFSLFAVKSYRRFIPKFLDYLRPNFHPDDDDASELVMQTKKTLGMS